LVPIANRPLITYLVDWLADYGVHEVCICGNDDTRALFECLADRSHGIKHLEYYEDIMPRGPAGCAKDAWCGSDCDKMLVVDGTIIPRIDLSSLIDFHEQSEVLMTVAVARGGADGCGLAGEWLSPLGVYVVSKQALEYVPKAGYCDIKETLIPRLHECGQKVVTYMAEAPSPRVTGTRSYMAVNEWLVEQMCGGSHEVEGYVRVGEALVHSSATIAPASRLIGPVLIGPGSKIEQGVTIVGPVSIGCDCVIGAGAVVCRSAVWDRCLLDADVTMDRCVLTHDGRLRGPLSVKNVVLG